MKRKEPSSGISSELQSQRRRTRTPTEIRERRRREAMSRATPSQLYERSIGASQTRGRGKGQRLFPYASEMLASKQELNTEINAANARMRGLNVLLRDPNLMQQQRAQLTGVIQTTQSKIRKLELAKKYPEKWVWDDQYATVHMRGPPPPPPPPGAGGGILA